MLDIDNITKTLKKNPIMATQDQIQEYLNKMTNWQRNKLGRYMKGNYKGITISVLERFSTMEKEL